MRKLRFESLEIRELLSITTPHTEIHSPPAAVSASSPGMERIHDVEHLTYSTNIAAIRSGDWSDPTMWSLGRIPTSADNAAIPHGVVVTLSDTLFNEVGILEVSGTLRFDPAKATRLIATTILVLPDGYFEAGTEANPVTERAEIVIRDTPFDLASDPDQIGHGLIVEGKIRLHGETKTTFDRLTVEPLAGATTLTLENVPQGWKAGDTLLIGDSRHLGAAETTSKSIPRPSGERGNYYTVSEHQDELVTIASINGNVVTLSQPLKYTHPGARDINGQLVYLPHVGSLSRTVRFISENPGGVRGHSLYGGGANVDLRYAEFDEFGRTTIARLKSTTYNPDGSVATIGANQVGRYSVHVHQLKSNSPAQPNGRQFNLVGVAVNGSPRWGIAIHGTHYGLIQSNVVYNADGAGIVTEDGSETGNIFDRNFAVRSDGSGSKATERTKGRTDNGHEGSPFWLRGSHQTVFTGNVAVGGQTAGITLFQFTDIKIALEIPKFQGADPNIADNWTIVRTRHDFSPQQFSDNESYGSFNAGLEVWNLLAGSQIDRQIVWNNSQRAINAWYMRAIKVVDPQIFLVPDKTNSMGIGANGNSGFTDIHVTSGRIHGAATGIMVNPRSHSTIVGVELANATNILVRYARAKSVGNPVLEIVDPVFISGVKVKMHLTGLPTRTIIGQQTTLLTLGGQNYQIYYQEQQADYIVPKTTRSIAASPEAGLTNQQNREMYGIAIAGAVAPNTAVVMEGIVGLVHKL